MAFKLNISEKGKAWKLEIESEFLVGKSVGDKIDGKEIKPELEGYELEITGGSDSAGFPLFKEVSGIGLKKVLFKKGWGMHDSKDGIRRKKTVRGKTISSAVSLINMKVINAGKKPLNEIFLDQNKVETEKKEEKKEVAVAQLAAG